MKTIISQEESLEVRNVARRYRVSEEKLWEAYQGCMTSNFYEDLCDIAKENEEELKGEK